MDVPLVFTQSDTAQHSMRTPHDMPLTLLPRNANNNTHMHLLCYPFPSSFPFQPVHRELTMKNLLLKVACMLLLLLQPVCCATTLSYNNKTYGTLDGSDPAVGGATCQTDFLPLPVGAVIAPDTQDIIDNVVVGKFNSPAPGNMWETHVLVLASGGAYLTSGASGPSNARTSGTPWVGNMLAVTGHAGTNPPVMYKPTSCLDTRSNSMKVKVLYELGPQTPCTGSFTDDEPTNHFTADCSGAVAHDAPCTIARTAHYALGSVTCDTSTGIYAVVPAVRHQCANADAHANVVITESSLFSDAWNVTAVCAFGHSGSPSPQMCNHTESALAKWTYSPCVPVICTSPDGTIGNVNAGQRGYGPYQPNNDPTVIITELELDARQTFSVTVECAPGYIGTPTATVCATSGPYSHTSCVSTPSPTASPTPSPAASPTESKAVLSAAVATAKSAAASAGCIGANVNATDAGCAALLANVATAEASLAAKALTTEGDYSDETTTDTPDRYKAAMIVGWIFFLALAIWAASVYFSKNKAAKNQDGIVNANYADVQTFTMP